MLPRMDLDLEWVRSRFTGLDPELAFFENAGGSVPARPVVDRAHDYLAHEMVQLDAGYPRSVSATEKVEAGKAAAAKLLGAPKDQVVLGASTTMSFYVLSHAFAHNLGPGDEVVVTDLDHEANRGCWIRMAEARGATVREWALDRDSHELDLAGLEAVLSERTRLVCFSHCSNVVGSLHDARAFVERSHEAGARVVIDAVAYAPHRRVQAQALGADAYAFSLYKVLGPHLSAMYVSEPMLEALANQNHAFLAGSGTYELMPGNVSHELAAALPGIVDYFEALDRHHGGPGALEGAFERIAAHEERLVDPLLSFLRDHPRVRLIGRSEADRARRVPTVTFVVEGRSSMSVPAALDGQGVAIRAGHFYAERAMQALGVDDAEDGVVRVSMLHYNSPAEVERLVESLAGELSR